MAERRRLPAAPVVLAGLASSGLVAVAADQPWMSATPTDATAAALAAIADPTPQVPLALTLSLVALAAWGVLLVTRGRVRRGVAALLVLATLGAAAATVSGWWLLPDQLRTSPGLSGLDVEVSVGAWYAVAVVASVVAVLPAVVALLQVPAWAEMGRRYDAPTGAVDAPPAGADEPGADGDETSNLDLWRSIDQGHDPTTRPPA